MLRLKGRGLTFEDKVCDQYVEILVVIPADINDEEIALYTSCLLYTSPSPRDKRQSRMPSSA